MNKYKSHRPVTGLLTYVSFWLRDRSSQLHKVKLELGPVLPFLWRKLQINSWTRHQRSLKIIQSVDAQSSKKSQVVPRARCAQK